MKPLFLSVFFVFSQIASANSQNSIATYLEEMTRAGRFKGTVLIADRGRVAFHGHFTREAKSKNDLDLQFRVASVTKTFTALGILKLQEQGRLSLEDPISRYVSYFKHGNLTIRELLTHSSGLPDWGGIDRRNTGVLEFIKFFQTFLTRFPKPAKTEHLVHEASRYKLLFEPGASRAYSNAGYALMGAVIESITGEPYHLYLAREVLAPADMTRSGFTWEKLPNRQSGHLAWGGIVVGGVYETHSTHAHAGGALYTTTGDMLKWHRALHAFQIVSEESFNEMIRPHVKIYDVKPEADYNEVQEASDQGLGVSLGEIDGNAFFGHSGTMPGFNAAYYDFYQRGLFIAVLENMLHLKGENAAPNIGFQLAKKVLTQRPN